MHRIEVAEQDASFDSESALQAAWHALDSDPASHRAKAAITDILERYRGAIDPQRETDLHRLLLDPDLDPAPYAATSWRLIERGGRLPHCDAAGAASLESDAFLRALLAETSVTVATAELALTALRRWLLLSGRAAAFPQATAALVAQAARNGGAWPFDAEERAALDRSQGALRAAYLPARPTTQSAAFASPVTTEVAAQYEGWPYPVWERTTRPRGNLQHLLRALGPGAPETLPDRPEILIAGCGTGREARFYAQIAPHAHITAIDLSAASLAYARQRCADVGPIDFKQHDLHDVASLGRNFDVIASSGVLHHLPDPEAGWAALVSVLRPGGVLNLQLYSKTARLTVRAARHKVADLLDSPVDDDLIRAARARLLGLSYNPLADSPDFYSMGGAHDLLLHVHEDPFDVPRIRAGVAANRLDFLGFTLPSARHRAQYRSDRPDDPHRRDYGGWHAIERANPTIFGQMYAFWCRKPIN